VERVNQWLALIGNIGVIAGIFFLAYEIQANIDAVRSATYQAYNESTFSWAETVWSTLQSWPRSTKPKTCLN